jgi:hypothetical protein
MMITDHTKSWIRWGWAAREKVLSEAQLNTERPLTLAPEQGRKLLGG